MIGWLVAAAGFLMVVAGVVVTVGSWWPLIPAGVVVVVVGLVVDFESGKGPPDGKRS